ncbi:hypothetical protein G7048_22820 [Diaphorobacter sp. HDW4B]|uniref:abortive infection system antitoxin AbiGi family protein n=1 Tax=Diaphorobacter sp. HDW4B TaxID=2714925 RepID=UPI0014095880|nr:abortive infection system antitoxin AbiGi family protein [Diaphorobacter sp. HDW4B]QIL72929.1 hypothetical protein G7048_22820 [Diaphorobacter sp. HDW4B]
MALSANTLIHFTKEKNSLMGILEENFRIFNCGELIMLGGVEHGIRVPMVSFCDIPLSEVKDHISKYGNYGIGMTKEWGVRKALNPVLYVAQNSMLSASYAQAFKHYALDSDKDVDEWTDEQKAIGDVLRYMKNYEGPLERKGVRIDRYRFSDEREWRFVPPYSSLRDMLVGESYYQEHKDAVDGSLLNMRLEFDPNDIKYIIINDDSEIGDFVDHLRRVKGRSYSLHDVERLTTRIFTTDQIKSDI